MKITTVGRGNIGGGLGRLWAESGHDVTLLGREGGDAFDADVVLVAVPSASISDALRTVTALEGKIVVDATNAFRGRDQQFESLRTRSSRTRTARWRKPSMRTQRCSSTR